MKELARAKTRLAEVLNPAQRAELCLAMLRDVLSVLCGLPGLHQVRVVSSDRAALDQALLAGAVPHPDHATDLNGALEGVARSLGPRDNMLIVPGDVPLLRSEEVLYLMAAGADGAAIVGTDDGGTGALWLPSPRAIAPRFGPDSFARHLEAAEAAGLVMTVCGAPGLARDLDRPQDLFAVAGSGRTESALLIAEFLGMSRRAA